MPHPMSNDLRERVVAFVEAGHSRNEAAARFGTSVSFAVNLMKLWRETGSVEPRPRGGFRHGKLWIHLDAPGPRQHRGQFRHGDVAAGRNGSKDEILVGPAW